eukprot:TRINITY_DN10183_c0_g3_i2.p2 TRINITY_DN10183_c0_g3~~TRINITY_DN10183_c0_g3_i2.p2  ORF type:complete len:175 (+),score=53.67 TRINITY_DN10183_c0_g3_i2:1336-1860(+)
MSDLDAYAEALAITWAKQRKIESEKMGTYEEYFKKKAQEVDSREERDSVLEAEKWIKERRDKSLKSIGYRNHLKRCVEDSKMYKEDEVIATIAAKQYRIICHSEHVKMTKYFKYLEAKRLGVSSFSDKDTAEEQISVILATQYNKTKMEESEKIKMYQQLLFLKQKLQGCHSLL